MPSSPARFLYLLLIPLFLIRLHVAEHSNMLPRAADIVPKIPLHTGCVWILFPTLWTGALIFSSSMLNNLSNWCLESSGKVCGNILIRPPITNSCFNQTCMAEDPHWSRQLLSNKILISDNNWVLDPFSFSTMHLPHLIVSNPRPHPPSIEHQRLHQRSHTALRSWSEGQSQGCNVHGYCQPWGLCRGGFWIYATPYHITSNSHFESEKQAWGTAICSSPFE